LVGTRLTGLANNAVYNVSVVAVDTGGNPSACSAMATGTANPDTTVTPTTTVAFGNVNIGQSADRTFTIANSGNATLTFTSLSCAGGTGTAGYTASPTSGTIAPGGTTTVTVHFAPTTAGFLSCVLSVVGDQTSGGAAINISGTGVNPNPIFVQSGIGDSVFTLPSYVTRVRVDASFSGSCQNFIVRVSTSTLSLINVIIGTCSVADTRSPFTGTYAINNGGVVTITNSTGVNWTFTELR
jgi:hypothetical protein